MYSYYNINMMYLIYTRALCNVRCIKVIEKKGITYLFVLFIYV